MKYYAFLFVCIFAFVCITPYAYKALPEKLRSPVRAAEETSFPTEESEDAEVPDEEKYALFLRRSARKTHRRKHSGRSPSYFARTKRQKTVFQAYRRFFTVRSQYVTRCTPPPALRSRITEKS